MWKLLPVACVLLVVIAGCPERPKVETEESTQKTEPEKKQARSEKPPAPVSRDSLAGNWVLQYSFPLPESKYVSYHSIALLRFTKSESKGEEYTAELLRTADRFQGVAIRKAEVRGKTVNIVLGRNNLVFDFQGRLAETEVRGNMFHPDQRFPIPFPARLLATNEANLDKFQKIPPHQKFPEFQQAMQKWISEQSREGFLKFIAEHPESPLAYFAVGPLDPLKNLKDKSDSRPDPDAIREYLKHVDAVCPAWGKRMQLAWRFRIAKNLTRMRLPSDGTVRRHLAPEVVLEIMAHAESPELAGQFGPQQPQMISEYRRSAEIALASRTLLDSQDAKQRAEALETLNQQTANAGPNHPWLTYVRAEAARRDGRLDRAVELYARMVALPALADDVARELKSRWRKPPDLRKRLEDLWVEKTGGKGNLDTFLAATYKTALRELRIAVHAPKPTSGPGHTALCEVFTSCDDRNFVGVDVASQLLQQAYRPEDLIVLRYHLDVPRPNPLVCNDSRARAFDYRIARPPAVVVNGRRLPLATRRRFGMTAVPGLTDFLRDFIDRQFVEKPPPATVAVSAKHQENRLEILMTVNGPEKPNEDLRLRVVLAEDHIDYTGENGIRRHEMVVRSLPMGTDGVPLEPGRRKFRKEVNLKNLSTQIRDFLVSFEEGQGVKFPFKPVGFRKLHVVALIQDKRSREILHCASDVVELASNGSSKNASPVKPNPAKGASKKRKSAKSLRPMQPPPPPLPVDPAANS